MKKISALIVITLIISATYGCLNRGTGKNDENTKDDTVTVPDTGYTGIKQYFSQAKLTYEVTFKNGVRHGLMKTFYADGKLRQTFWYENGMREDTAIWFYEDGRIFRKTPFAKDSMNGVQTQYYRSGKVRAKLDFVNGLRKPYLEEFANDGRKITDYPSVVIKTKDEYNINGTYNIYLELSKKDVKANYYRGEFIDGLFAPKQLKKINSSEAAGFLKLTRSGSPQQGYVGIISEISTSLGNKLILYNRIDLPYNDLK